MIDRYYRGGLEIKQLLRLGIADGATEHTRVKGRRVLAGLNRVVAVRSVFHELGQEFP